jgi:hypothetical protein
MTRHFSSLALVALGAGLLAALPCRAAKVKVWHRHTPAHYEKARLQGTVVSSEGTLRLSRRLQPLAALDASHVWALAEDHDGNLYAATGGPGKVYKVSRSGKTTPVYTGENSQVLSLAVGPDNTVYAGTGPAGRVLRIDPKGRARAHCDLGEGYVWSLALDPKGQALYAGTGPRGRIYRVTAEGKASVFYATRQEHVLCLATDAEGMVYAGTDKGGLVYRIDPRGKGFVLYQAPQAEVHTLQLSGHVLYAGTSAPTHHGVRSSASESHGGSDLASLDDDDSESISASRRTAAALKKPEGSGHGRKELSSAGKEKAKGGPAPAPSCPGSGDNSVYRISPDGAVREVFREKAMVLSLLRQGDHFFAGTGMEGQLFEFDESSSERVEVARLDHGQILCLCRRQDGSVVLGTGDPGKLYVLRDTFQEKGSATSEVLDAKLVSRWGSLRWQAETTRGTGVTVAVRSGNVAEPDETWSDWSEEQADADHAVIQAPAARFLQYRVTLRTDDPAVTPAVQAVTLRYMTTNQAPEVTRVEVPDLNAVNLEQPKKLKFKWSATDPNEDDLTYSVYVRKEGWKSWVRLEDDLDRTEYEWDTTTAPSGVYRLKVVASDRKDNPDQEALAGARVSAPFVVSHTPPGVTVQTAGMEGSRVVVEATARSPLVRLTAASFAVNGKKWVHVFPADGLFDSKAETFRFRTEALRPGTYVLVLKVKDAAGNTGSGDVVFTVPTQTAER